MGLPLKKTVFTQEHSAMPYRNFITSVNTKNFAALTDCELQTMLREDTEAPEEDLTAKRYAVIKEIVLRRTGLRLFDTQLAASYAMKKGNIAELPTGEGKTLSAVAAAICFVLGGKKVHILVFNDYLAKRDCLWYGDVYNSCGLTTGYIDRFTSREQRKEIYTRDVVYVTVKEAGFDNLKDFLCECEDDLISPAYDTAIVDEADSIFIDEAKTPLVLAGDLPEELNSKMNIESLIASLNTQDVVTDLEQKQVYLSDTGISRIEKALDIENLYEESSAEALSLINAGITARFLLTRDKDYIVKDKAIQVVDELTGRVVLNRKFPDLIHHAVEIKEKLAENDASMIFNSTTVRSFLLNYKTLCGMTGTIRSSKDEIWNLYGLEIDVIPPHIPCIRLDREDAVFPSDTDRLQAVLDEVLRAHTKGQPVLMGTRSVAESELYAEKLTALAIEHSVLNARNDEQESEIIARAGEPFRVTVSTNMAGRGVDIKLGGVDEKEKAAVAAAGGLYIIGVGMNRSLRIDLQLSGRAGRQGDPGESRFFVSLDDNLLKAYAKDKNWFEYIEPGEPVTEKSILKDIRRIQKYSEGEDAEARYMLEKYSIIMEQQRKIISERRKNILTGKDSPSFIRDSDPDYYEDLLERYGEKGVMLAEKQLALYYINRRWADYLNSMENARNGIHLMIVGGRRPLDEYHRIAIAAFDEMMEEIREDIVEATRNYPITENGIDMKSAGLIGATSTRTYMIDESKSQFRKIPHLIKSMSNRIDGPVFTVRGLLKKLGQRWKTSKNQN
jgi:preprotein translocase subunit SecA